jgi:dynein heavy chain, axonemal
VVEEELKNERSILTGQLLDFKKTKLQVIYSFTSITMWNDYLQQISVLGKELETFQSVSDELLAKEKRCGGPGIPTDLLETMTSDLQAHSSLWKLCQQVPKIVQQLKKERATELDVVRISESSGVCMEETSLLLKKFDAKMKCHQLATELYQQLQQIVDLIPVLKFWSNPHVRDRHWSKAFQILGKQPDPAPSSILFGSLYDWRPLGFSVKAQFEALNDTVNNEYVLDEAVESMQLEWSSYSFSVRAFGSSGTFYVESMQEAIMMAQEAAIKMKSMLRVRTGNQGRNEKLEDVVDEMARALEWQGTISFMESVLSVWPRVQQTFLSVQPLFASKRLRALSVQESFIFNRVDELYRTNMAQICEAPSLKAISQRRNLLSDFQAIEHDLEFLSKAVEDFVSKARVDFARFYFVADQDLLDILTLTHENFGTINRDIGKIFPGVSSIEYVQKHRQIVGLCSKLSETIQLIPVVYASIHDQQPRDESQCSTHLWLRDIETIMVENVGKQIDKARLMYEFASFDKWMQEHTQQSMAVAQSILFAIKTEEILSNTGSIRKLLSDGILTKQHILEDIIETLQSHTLELARHKCSAAALQSISERDMLQRLLAENPRSAEDFSWQSKFRYSWARDPGSLQGSVVMRIMQHQFAYGFEYIGNDVPLAWSLSLERCYKVVGCAFGAGLWGALAGNMTTCSSFIQDLANSFGTVCFPFGWDLLPSPTILNQLCKGVAASRFWLAFRSIDQAPTKTVLQTLCTSMSAVQNAIRMRSKTACVDGDMVDMRSNTGIFGERFPPSFFVTVDKQLGGEALPEALATMFRPTVIQAHDFVYIIEVVLFANGFRSAADLARKADFAFQAFRERLSFSSLYNFKKAALMKVIYDIIDLRQQYPHEPELKLLTRALLLKAPSIVPDESEIFYQVIMALSDDDVSALAQSNFVSGRFTLFQSDLLNFESNISLIANVPAGWKSKVLELISVACVRNGLILIGQTGTGKTSCVNAMTDAIRKSLMKNIAIGHVEATCIFPKALTLAELYGQTGKGTAESAKWTDGLIPTMFRSEAQARAKAHSRPKVMFCIMDGPMDPDWSDKLSCTLEDGSGLKLPSLETLPGPELITFVFEGEDLKSASPATVSKCGIVHFSNAVNFWFQSAVTQAASWDSRILSQWVQLDEDAFAAGRDVFDALLEHLLGPALRFISSECKEQFPVVSNVHRAWMHLMLFQRLCMDALQEQEKECEDPAQASKGILMRHCEWLTNNFIFALILSLGTLLDENSQQKFEIFLRDLLSLLKLTLPARRRSGKLTHGDFKVTPLQRSEPCTSLAYVYKGTKKGWIPWKEMPVASAYQEVRSERLEDLVVPTTNFLRYNCLLGCTLDAQCHTLMTGPAACGKSLYITSKIKNYLPSPKFTVSSFTTSASTGLDHVHRIIWQNIETTCVGQVIPKGDKSLVVIIEDMNLASRDIFGSSSALELVRHLMDKKSVYSRAIPPMLSSIDRVQVISTNQSRRGISSSMPLRLLRHNFVLNVSAQSDDDIRDIFSASLGWYHAKQEFPQSILDLKEKLTDASITLYREIGQRLKPNILCPHYLFSLRDLNAVLAGMMLQTKEDILHSVDSPENEHLRLWAHEVIRTFYDRMKDPNDKAWFLDSLKRVIWGQLGIDFNQLFKHLDLNNDGDIDADELRRLFFGSYQAGPGAAQMRGERAGYDEVENPEEMVSLMTSHCQKYNAENNQPMQLFMTLYSVEHISRIARVLTLRQGHALLLGSTGVGKRSLTRIASFVRKTKHVEICIDTAQDPEGTAWRAHLKRLVRICGLGLAPSVTVLLNNTVLTTESLRDVCCILNCNEVPGLFTIEEKQILVDEMESRGLIEKAVMTPPIEELFGLLLELAYDAMHLIICVDPNTWNLRDLLSNYPMLATRCYIDWFEDWPPETLQQMAQQHLPNLFDDQIYGTFGQKIIAICGTMHNKALNTARSYTLQINRSNVHITQTDYAIFLKQFASLLRQVREEVSTETAILNSAYAVSAQIKDRVKNVGELGRNMLKQHEEMLETKAKEEFKLKSLEKTVSGLKKKVDRNLKLIKENINAQKVAEEQLEVERNTIKEWWKTASQIVLTLSPRDIGKLKSTVNMDKKCPECVEDLSMALLALFEGTLRPSDTKDDRAELMNSAKKIVTSIDFKKKLTSVDPDPDGENKFVKGASIVRARFLKKKNFNYDSIARVCTGSEKIFQWVSEALAYEEKVKTRVEPLKAELAKLKQDVVPIEVEKAAQIEEHSAESAKVSVQMRLVEDLTARDSNFEGEFARFNRQTELCNSLCDLMFDEYVDHAKDWVQRLGHLTRMKKTLEVDCLLAAATITYLGGLPLTARECILTLWMQMLAADGLCPETNEFDLAHFFIDSKELGLDRKIFELHGLPMDSVSVMNACILTRCYKAPLVIDPHGVFTGWIEKREKEAGLMVVSMKEDYLGKLRFAVQEGLHMLIKDVDSLPLVLQSLSSLQLVTKKGRQSVFVGDVMVPYNPAFRLYMATRDENPIFSPEDAIWTTIVNFNLSQAGVEEYILNGLSEDKLEPLHRYRSSCLERYIKSAQSLIDLDLRHFLPRSTEDLIIDENLLEQIASARQDWIQARVVAMDNLRKYRAARERSEMLRTLASQLATLFQALWRMTSLHVSYQNVLNMFVTLVLMDLEAAAENEEAQEPTLRENASVFEDLCAGYEDLENVEEVDLDTGQLKRDISELGQALTRTVFFDLVRSLYEKDHLLFAFMAAVETQMSKGSIDPEELQHFLTNGEFPVPIGAEIRGTERVEIDDDEDDTTVWQGFGRSGIRGNAAKPHPGFSWLSERQWQSACTLSSLKTIQTTLGSGGITGSITDHPDAWRQYLAASYPTDTALPNALSATLSPFQQLLLLRIFHPHCVVSGMKKVVQKWCGVDVSRIPPLDISAAYEDSLSTIPLLFILDPGTDPTADIEAFASREFSVSDSRQLITTEATLSSAQGFEALLKQCMETGNWMLVRNVHMEARFLQTLEEAFYTLGSGEPDDSFRLWITSLGINLSKTIYRSCMRVMWDAPVSVRAGMLRSYSSSPMVCEDFFHQARNEKQDRLFRRCLFAMCMMHSAVIERCEYGTLGWNFSPNLTSFDLKFAMLQIQNITHDFEHSTVKDVRQVVQDSVYAGKFADEHDLETFHATLLSFMPDGLSGRGLEYSEDGIYRVPEVQSLSEYESYIVDLPTCAGASIFGLAQLCDVARFEAASVFYLKRLQDMHFLRPLEIQEDQSRGQARLHRMLTAQSTRTAVVSLFQSIPRGCDLNQARSKYPVGKEDHRNGVLMQELETRNKLYSAMRTSLQSLLLCLDGVEPTSTEMELMALDLYYSRVPDNWMKFSCLSRKTLASYMRYLNDSNHFFTSWLEEGVPTSIWLPAFSFPNLLFSATAINFAQHSKIGIESVALSFEILKREPFHVGMTAGVYVTGLSLNWARWDFPNAEIQPLALPGVKSLLAGSRGVTTTSSGASVESRTAPEGREPAAMWQVPVLHVKPARSNSLGKNAPRDVGPRAGGDDDLQHSDVVIASDSPGHAVYTCPMYRTSLRKNIDGTVALSNAANGFILNVPLPCFTPIHFTSEPQRFYSRLGTALLIETEP